MICRTFPIISKIDRDPIVPKTEIGTYLIYLFLFVIGVPANIYTVVTDDYLQREFSPLFEGGLTNDMPATLYHFEGADADVPFTLAAVAESGVA